MQQKQNTIKNENSGTGIMHFILNNYFCTARKSSLVSCASKTHPTAKGETQVHPSSSHLTNTFHNRSLFLWEAESRTFPCIQKLVKIIYESCWDTQYVISNSCFPPKHRLSISPRLSITRTSAARGLRGRGHCPSQRLPELPLTQCSWDEAIPHLGEAQWRHALGTARRLSDIK